ELPGLPIVEMTRDQKEAVRDVLQALLEPYRPAYQKQVLACLDKQGGLDRCHLTFYREHTLGKEGEWDNWRIEGPAFVWYFRGTPHVHIWIHVALSLPPCRSANPSQPIPTRGAHRCAPRRVS